jgi:hypothetical protein
MVMSSLPYDERTEYDDLAGEAEPSLTPLPKPRGVLATTGATSRGGGGGGGVRRSGGDGGGGLNRNDNHQDVVVRNKVRQTAVDQEVDNNDDDYEGGGGRRRVYSSPDEAGNNFRYNGHARNQQQDQQHISYPNDDDEYPASSPSSHQDGGLFRLNHGVNGEGRSRKKGSGAGQLASNHHRHINVNKNPADNIILNDVLNSDDGRPVGISKLQEAQMRMRLQQQRGGAGITDPTKIQNNHYQQQQQQIHQRGAASGPIHPDDRSSYINVDIGGPRVAHTINDKLANRSEQDQLAFSRKARPTHYTPKTLSEFKMANDALGTGNSGGRSPGGGGVDTVGVRNRKSAPPGYYELGKLGPDLSNEELLKIKAAKERQREYAAQVSTSAREKAAAAAAASASALNLAANIAAVQNQQSPSSSSHSQSGSYSPDALSQHANSVMQQMMHPSSSGGGGGGANILPSSSSTTTTTSSLPYGVKRKSKDPAYLEKEKGANLRERVKEYSSKIPVPQPVKTQPMMIPTTSLSTAAPVSSSSLLPSSQAPLHGRRSIVLSGSSSASNRGKNIMSDHQHLDPLSSLEREHELHRQQVDRIRAELSLE